MKLTKTFIENIRKAISADIKPADDPDRFFAAFDAEFIINQEEVDRHDLVVLNKAMNYLGIPSITLNCYVRLAATEEDLVDYDILEA